MPRLCYKWNLEYADMQARRGKKCKKAIIEHSLVADKHYKELINKFQTGTYKTSPYNVFKIFEPKERIIYRLPYYPDRLTHHAIMSVVKDLWIKQFIPNTYSCVPERGITKLVHDLKRDLYRYEYETEYCLKLDITKFYPSINHQILKDILARKIKDKKFLELLGEIIDSVNDYVPQKGTGVPIGNYLSQYFSNLYLTYFDRWCKETLHCRFYYRYADDIVILSHDKKFLHDCLKQIKDYLKTNLKLTVKPNHQVFPVESRGIDFVGYVFRHNYIRVRKKTKKKIMRLVTAFKHKKICRDVMFDHLAAYLGILKYADSKHLLKKIEDITGIRYSNFKGKLDLISNFYNNDSTYVIEAIGHHKYYNINFTCKGKPYTVRSRNIRQWFELKCDLELPTGYIFIKHEKPKCTKVL